MTVAVAARFPWGRLRKVLSSLPGSRFPSAIILLTDSRWTYADRPPEDMGQKLWRLAPERGIGAVFAGDVRAAEEALETMRDRLKKTRDINPEIVASLASSVLTHVYQAHVKSQSRNAKPEALNVIIGMVNRNARSAMLSFSAATEFRPALEDEVVAVG
ncbi:MAG: hypothetical protein WD379_03685 [Dehalococcoidia bacterium]